MKKTLVNINSSDNSLTYDSRSLFIGSCFSDEVGARLRNLGFTTMVNPFGVVFNPISILTILKNESISPERITMYDDVFLHYDFHSEVHGYSKEELLNRIHLLQDEVDRYIKTASHIFITLGTSWVYEYQGTVVNNCHRQNPTNFSKRLLDLKEITKTLKELVSQIRTKNKGAAITFTVSPVRHIKNGVAENSISKARLLSAIYEMQSVEVDYFPAYEIAIDELRDYAYFEKDGVHLNDLGVEIVFDHFVNTYMQNDVVDVLKQVKSLNARMNHRPQFKHSKSWEEFQNILEKDLSEFRAKYPNVRLKK